MKRKVIILCSAAFFLLAAILGVASNFMLNTSLCPGHDEAFSREKAWESLFRSYPDMRVWRDSLTACGALRDTIIEREDGVRLHAFFVAAAQKTGRTAIVVHGYNDCAVHLMHIGRMYSRDLGFNILLPDLFHHGESMGDAIQMGWKDRLDVMRWMSVAADVFETDRMVVHGISMGAATTMMLSGEELPAYAKAFVEDCGYTSVWDEFESELKKRYNLPAFPVLYTSDWLCQWRYGWSFAQASALEQVKKCRRPMFFIHGDSDDFVPTAMVYPLYEAATCPKELWLVEGVAHAASYDTYPEEYTRRVRSFLDKYMQ